MVFPHRECGCAAVAAPIPVYRWDLIKSLKPGNARRVRDKVATGQSPVALTTLGGMDEGKPGWFSLSVKVSESGGLALVFPAAVALMSLAALLTN
jgi:hypothetical protein